MLGYHLHNYCRAYTTTKPGEKMIRQFERQRKCYLSEVVGYPTVKVMSTKQLDTHVAPYWRALETKKTSEKIGFTIVNLDHRETFIHVETKTLSSLEGEPINPH